MRIFLKTCYTFLLLSFVALNVWATGLAPTATIGDMAQTAMEPVGIFTDVMHATCFIIGGSFLFASIIKFIEHRRSPLMVPLSTVAFLLIAGTVLVLLPIVTGGVQIQFSLLR